MERVLAGKRRMAPKYATLSYSVFGNSNACSVKGIIDFFFVFYNILISVLWTSSTMVENITFMPCDPYIDNYN